ncbi:MAG: phosphotransferase [Thiomonas sp.]|uniref:Aminoglycoside phosphotransferase domain-containing protein n=1 Tax=mine drainage metagenome TaxID=410659 RepID=E6PRE4_9ZZZZ
MQADTREVAPALAFDVAALANYLRGRMPDVQGPLQVAQFKGGQSNPTYLLTAAGGRRFVLRRKPPGKLLPSAHAVDREFRVMQALGQSQVPVPHMQLLCMDESVIGTPFYLMDFVEGRILWDPLLPGMQPTERAAIFDEMNRVIAALHRVDEAALGLGDYGKPGQYIARQVARWTQQYRASETERIEAMDKLIDWLPAHIPPGDETAIVHGDYRLDNVVFHPTEPRILAVLDWELSTLGHPLADFAYHCMAWRLEPGQFRGLVGGDLAALGIPSEAEYVARYCERTQRAPVSPSDWEFYAAFNMFRLAGILQGVLARALQGNASSAQALEAGRRARPLAEAAWAQVERVFGH